MFLEHKLCRVKTWTETSALDACGCINSSSSTGSLYHYPQWACIQVWQVYILTLSITLGLLYVNKNWKYLSLSSGLPWVDSAERKQIIYIYLKKTGLGAVCQKQTKYMLESSDETVFASVDGVSSDVTCWYLFIQTRLRLELLWRTQLLDHRLVGWLHMLCAFSETSLCSGSYWKGSKLAKTLAYGGWGHRLSQ